MEKRQQHNYNTIHRQTFGKSLKIIHYTTYYVKSSQFYLYSTFHVQNNLKCFASGAAPGFQFWMGQTNLGLTARCAALSLSLKVKVAHPADLSLSLAPLSLSCYYMCTKPNARKATSNQKCVDHFFLTRIDIVTTQNKVKSTQLAVNHWTAGHVTQVWAGGWWSRVGVGQSLE